VYAIALVLLKLTVWEVVTDVPHDFAAIVTYAMLALFVVGIWYGSRRNPAAPKISPPAAGDGA